jgi:cardiolipin-specific phospholipase
MRYSTRRLQISDPLEAAANKDYLLQTNMRNCSSEVSITIILKFGLFAVHPLVDVLETLQMPVSFQYGGHDWMSPESANDLLSKGKLPEGSEVKSIDKAGHQLFIDNPNGCI